MLRGLLGFGKDDRPQPPKGKIEVVCPTCGAVQFEPRLVVSTFCKKCGDHLRIEKKRVTGTGVRHDRPAEPSTPPSPKVQGPARAVERAGAGEIGAAAQRAASPSEAATHPDAKNVLRSIIGASAHKDEDTAQAGSSASKSSAEDAHAGDAGFGTMLQRAGDKKEPAPRPQFPEEPRPHSNMPAPTPAPPPASASTLQKMKDQGFYRQQYFKDAQCFDCGHLFKVGRSARSANCPQCGAWISMEDVEINMNSTQVIKTRGDVIIRKRGHLSTSIVQCKDFHCQGLLEANVTATGDACFRTGGTVVGEIRCHRLVIEKGADVTFVNPIYADQVEIHAKITGTVFSRGAVLITTYGAVNGDVTARSVSIEPGGELNGAMNIIRGDTTLFDPTRNT